MSNKKVIAVCTDTETTGFDVIGGDMIVVAFVEILEDFTLGRKKVFYLKPMSVKYFTDKAVGIHGISYWKALTFPEPEVTCKEILHWFKPLMHLFPLTMVYQGTGNFDYRWIESTFRKSELLSSLQKIFRKDKIESTTYMARKQIKGLPNYKLPELAKHYGLYLNHHKAMSDTIVAAEVWCNLKQDKKTWTGELF